MKIGTLAVAASLAALPAAFGGFTVTAQVTFTGAFDVWRITAVNTGGVTGSEIKGLEYFYEGTAPLFEVNDLIGATGENPDGIPDTVNLLSTTRTRIRVNFSPFSNAFVGVEPTNAPVQPNPYTGGLTAFSGAIANTGTTIATGTGFEIARLYLPTQSGYFFRFSGNLGGDIGTKVPFSVVLGDEGNVPPTIVNNQASTTAVFGPVVSGGAPFSIQIQATDPNPGTTLSLAMGPLPAGLSNVLVSPASSGSPASFTISGLADYSLNGSQVVVPFTVSDTPFGIGGVNTVAGSFLLQVIPEPGLLAGLGIAPLLPRRRR